jgi:hypothetical protein
VAQTVPSNGGEGRAIALPWRLLLVFFVGEIITTK